HAQKIIHRDLKPDNVFLVDRSRPDHVKVLDFGISKFMAQSSVDENPEEHTMTKTRQGELLGTPDFMAPEQITDPQHIDGRVDVYSLGVILYQMLSGRLPLENASLSRMLEAIISETPPPLGRLCPALPKTLVAAIERAMEKSPDKRQPTMAALEAELHPFVIEPDARRQNANLSDSSRIEVVTGEPQAPSVRITPPKRDRAEGNADTLATPEFLAKVRVPEAKAPSSTSLEPTSAPMPASPKPWWQTWVVAIPCVALALFLASRGDFKDSTASSPIPAVAPPTVAPVTARETVDFSVVSATPEASMTFRGKTKRLPFREEVRRGVDPELIEITAPGHQGRQFWLVLDEPTRLASDLTLGSGMMRAEDEPGLTDAAPSAPADPQDPIYP
ncbi:MAG: protein kinase, partial [Polyangiaceae bacterium]